MGSEDRKEEWMELRALTRGNEETKNKMNTQLNDERNMIKETCYENFMLIELRRKFNALERRRKKIRMRESKNEKEEQGTEEEQNKPELIQIKTSNVYISLLRPSVRTVLRGNLVAFPSFHDNG